MDKKIETHGKDENNTEPTTLDQVWGFNELGRYGTTDVEAYAAQVNDMNRPELERHARAVGVLVVENTARLRDSLVREFRVHFSLLNKPKQTTTGAISTTAPKVSDDVRKILAEGR